MQIARRSNVPAPTAARRSALDRLPRWEGALAAELALARRSPPFSDRAWLFELKYDGFRLLAAKDGASITLRYRTGRDVSTRFPSIAAAVAALPLKRVLLDCELVAFGPDGRSSFDLLRASAFSETRQFGQSRHSDVSACAFDILALDNADLRRLPLRHRKQILQDIIPRLQVLRAVEHLEGRGEELFAGARALGLEGIVAKKADAPYRAGRTGDWLKFKVEETHDFIVIGIADPSAQTFWRSALMLAVNGPRGLRYVGQVAVQRAQLDALDPVLPVLRRSSPPCRASGAAVWMNPGVVCEVRYLASPDRGLRHSAFVRFRVDKGWRDCAELPRQFP